jgi:hypothetical protein
VTESTSPISKKTENAGKIDGFTPGGQVAGRRRGRWLIAGILMIATSLPDWYQYTAPL